VPTVLIMAVTISARSHQSEGSFGWSGGFLFGLVDGSFMYLTHQCLKMNEVAHSAEYDYKSSLAHVRNVLNAIFT